MMKVLKEGIKRFIKLITDNLSSFYEKILFLFGFQKSDPLNTPASSTSPGKHKLSAKRTTDAQSTTATDDLEISSPDKTTEVFNLSGLVDKTSQLVQNSKNSSHEQEIATIVNYFKLVCGSTTDKTAYNKSTSESIVNLLNILNSSNFNPNNKIRYVVSAVTMFVLQTKISSIYNKPIYDKLKTLILDQELYGIRNFAKSVEYSSDYKPDYIYTDFNDYMNADTCDKDKKGKAQFRKMASHLFKPIIIALTNVPCISAQDLRQNFTGNAQEIVGQFNRDFTNLKINIVKTWLNLRCILKNDNLFEHKFENANDLTDCNAIIDHYESPFEASMSTTYGNKFSESEENKRSRELQLRSDLYSSAITVLNGIGKDSKENAIPMWQTIISEYSESENQTSNLSR